jgi:hypothetical protein
MLQLLTNGETWLPPTSFAHSNQPPIGIFELVNQGSQETRDESVHDFFWEKKDSNYGLCGGPNRGHTASHTREHSGWQLAQGWLLEPAARVERALSSISDRWHTALPLIQSKLFVGARRPENQARPTAMGPAYSESTVRSKDIIRKIASLLLRR